VALVALATGCGLHAGDHLITGKWDGEWRAADGSTAGTLLIDFIQSGREITGFVVLRNYACFETARITGTIRGDRLRFGAEADAARMDFEATSIREVEMHGTFRLRARGECLPDRGRWEVEGFAVLPDNPTPP
jgi:hypothetical protein